MDAEILREIIGLEPDAQARADASHPALTVPVDKVHECLKRLRDDARFQFDLLLDHTAIDWPEEQRFELLYLLYSTTGGRYLMIFTSIPRDNPVAPTVSDLWLGAEWQEREVFDMFGIKYDNHPDLRRVFLEDEWEGYPLRKDYQDDYMLGLPK